MYSSVGSATFPDKTVATHLPCNSKSRVGIAWLYSELWYLVNVKQSRVSKYWSSYKEQLIKDYKVIT